MLTRPALRAAATAAALSLSAQVAAAQRPINYTPPPVAAPAPPGTLPLASLPEGARDALLAGIDAMQTWSNAQADAHFAHVLEIDSTIGLARVLRVHMRGWIINHAQFVRGAADMANRVIGEQTVALAYRAGNPQAVALFAAAAAMYPNDARLALEHAGRLSGAARLDSLRSLTRRYPDHVATHMSLAYYLTLNAYVINAAQAQEALAAAERAVSLAPQTAGSHVALGHVLQRMGRYDEAVPHLTGALRIDPKHAIAYELLAEIYLRDGAPNRIARARAALDSARLYTVSGHHGFEVASTSALLLMHEGKVDEVFAHDTTLIARAQATGYTAYTSIQWGRLAVLAAATGRAQLAESYLARAKIVYPPPNTAMLTLEMHAYELLKRPDDARRARDAWLALLPNASTAGNQQQLAMHNAMILLAENKPAEALTACAGVPDTSTVKIWCEFLAIEANVALGRQAAALELRRALLARKNVDAASLPIAIQTYRSLQAR
jgi:tetratricopeptide (TPR) repeat protein